MDTFQTRLGLETHLRGQHEQLRTKITAGQTAIAAEMGAFSGVRSQAAMHAGVRMLNKLLTNYFDTSTETAPSWIGPTLSESEVKQLYASELREVLYELAVPKAAYKPHPPSWEALENLRETLELRLAGFQKQPLKSASAEALSDVRFELDDAASNEDGDDADARRNLICLRKDEILISINRLIPIVSACEDPTLTALAEPDLQTLRAQLVKIDPNIVILQEAGRCIEKSLQSSTSWDNAPALQHASRSLSLALGLV